MVKLILIGIIWFNPVTVSKLSPDNQHPEKCRVATIDSNFSTVVDMPCDQVAKKLTEQEK